MAAIQSFIIHRHGARYAIKKPEHNAMWPVENRFWKCHTGKLTPIGVLQMVTVGQLFRMRYPWVTSKSVRIFSTHRSRALESAWSFVLGLLPGTPIKFQELPSPVSLEEQICSIQYYHKGEDKIFGQADPRMAHKLNINRSPLLQELVESEKVIGLVNRLATHGHFRIRRDSITTISKLKDIHSQLGVDAQLGLPAGGSLIGKYGLSSEELEIIRAIGNEVIARRLIPATDLVAERGFNEDQGRGIITAIQDQLQTWTGRNSELNVYSCHDTNLIAVMALLGIRIDCPEFAGYILIERTLEAARVFYCLDPFDGSERPPKFWPELTARSTVLNWDQLPTGQFDIPTFLRIFNSDSMVG